VLTVLAWAKENEVELASVSVGPAGCAVTLVRAVGSERRDPAPDPRVGLYRKMGGEVFKHAVEAGDIDENGLVPAVR
jgi:hypothetical protein